MSRNKLDLEKVSRNLKKIREQKGFSQAYVAQALGLKQGTVSDYERGRVNLPLGKVVELAELYQCSIDHIVGFESGEDKGEEDISGRMAPLFAIGIFGHQYEKIENEIVKDPSIMIHLKLNQVHERNSLFSNVVNQLNEKQRRSFTLSLLKHLYSLIAVDKNYASEEIAFFTYLREQLFFKPSLDEVSSIRLAGATQYLSSDVEREFPTLALRRFTLWVLNILSSIDRERHPTEIKYIEKVAKHLDVDLATTRFIADKVASTLLGRSEQS
ncbi:MAG: helix-turn-helix domain-containing protein [Bacteriovoracia bacterium]